MVASYYLGQKHYPIPYNLRKFGLYAVVALMIYGTFSWINIEAGVLQFFVHNTAILLFLGLIYWMEKSKVDKVST